MINKKYILALMVAAQMFVPANMILQQEKVLKKGVVYKFKTVPVDPYDILRGRYVSLRADVFPIEYKGKEKISRGQIIYALLGKDNQGYAMIKSVSMIRPKEGDYARVKVSYKSRDKIYVDSSLDRFYMNEYKAPKAEKLYRKYSARDKKEAYILARVLKGKVAIEDLYLDNKPILSYFSK